MTASPYFHPLSFNNQTWDLSHLEPFSMEIESEMAKKTLTVHVTFSCHCFSRSHKGTDDVKETILDAGGRPRVFCPIRYNLSLTLASIIQRLNDPKVKVKQTTARRNWVYSIVIEDPSGPYHVFFELKRAAKGKPQDLNLVVESAYQETEGEPSVLGSIGFVLLCGKVYTNKPVATKR